MKKKKVVSTRSKNLSLNPLNFEEALTAILSIPPPTKKKKATSKRKK